MMTYQKWLGKKGEEIAAEYLRKKDYQILDQNFSSRYGELDLIALDSGDLVFVEVKTRTSQDYGMPEESITPEKLNRIESTGLIWLQEHPEITDQWRIDAVAIILNSAGEVIDIQHFINTYDV